MNAIKDPIKAALLADVEHMSLQVVLVGPTSLKSKPPTAIQVCITAVLRAENSAYREVSARSLGVTINEAGSMFAKAKYRCVIPVVLISLMAILLQARSRTFLASSSVYVVSHIGIPYQD